MDGGREATYNIPGGNNRADMIQDKKSGSGVVETHHSDGIHSHICNIIRLNSRFECLSELVVLKANKSAGKSQPSGFQSYQYLLPGLNHFLRGI